MTEQEMYDKNAFSQVCSIEHLLKIESLINELISLIKGSSLAYTLESYQGDLAKRIMILKGGMNIDVPRGTYRQNFSPRDRAIVRLHITLVTNNIIRKVLKGIPDYEFAHKHDGNSRKEIWFRSPCDDSEVDYSYCKIDTCPNRMATGKCIYKVKATIHEYGSDSYHFSDESPMPPCEHYMSDLKKLTDLYNLYDYGVSKAKEYQPDDFISCSILLAFQKDDKGKYPIFHKNILDTLDPIIIKEFLDSAPKLKHFFNDNNETNK